MSAQREPLVMLHGWGHRASVFDAFAARLPPGCAPLHADLPGYGPAPPASPPALDGMARAVLGAMPGRAVLAGWSLGALVALACALAAPERVSALVLFAPNPCFVAREGWPHGVDPALHERFRAGVEADPDATLARFAALAVAGCSGARATLRSLLPHLATGGWAAPDVLAGGLAVLRDADLRDTVGAVGRRTLVVHGERDAVSPRGASVWLAGAMPDARLALVPDAGHAPFVSHAQACAAAVAEFLA